jgi:TetR/AcrR family transcriptional repressor of nem operon
MRNRIKRVAAELLVKHGYRGLRFGDIAGRLDTTRANIHYHFGTKQKLVEEVVDDYLDATLGRFRAIWLDEETSLADKIRGTMEFNRERYQKFNRGCSGAKPWSLIARMRLERDLLTERTNVGLRNFRLELDAMIAAAIELAKARGELAAEAPVRDIALQIAGIANSSGSLTVDAGSFDPIEQLYLALARVITHAYGRKVEPRSVADKGALAQAG